MIPPHLDFHHLRHVPIAAVLGARGIALRRRGARAVGCCPIHGGDNPGAFVVEQDRNLWYCFSRCQRGGDVIDLVQQLDGVGPAAAARTLAQLVGRTGLPTQVEPGPRRAGKAFVPYTRILRLDPYDELLRHKRIHPAVARRFEAGRYYGRGFLRGCLGVRLHDPLGQPLGYAGRRLDPTEAHSWGKWKLPPRLPKQQLLYGWHRVRRQLGPRGVVLVEGAWDVMRLAQLGVPAVALLGLHLSSYQADLLRPVHRVVLMLDGDEAGRTAAPRIAAGLRRACPTILLPDGCDPDDLADPALISHLAPFFSS